jgi:hypothetical protein
LQDPPKYTQIWIFCLKTNHLATLPATLAFGTFSVSFPETLYFVRSNLKRKRAQKIYLVQINGQVCQIYLGTIYQSGGKMYQTSTKLLSANTQWS